MNWTSIIAASLGGCLLVSACGGGSDSGATGSDGDVEAFCRVLRDAESQDDVDLGDDFEAGMAQLQTFREDAPPAVQADLDVLIGKFEELNELEAASAGDDGTGVEAAFEILLDPEFIAAAENVEAFGVDECGLDASTGDDAGFTDGGADAGVSDGPVEAPVSDDGLIREAANVPDPLFDPVFDDDVVDPTEVSISGAAYFLDVNYTAAPWRTRLSSWTTAGSGTDFDIVVGGTDISASDAAEICSAIAEYISSLNGDGAISITTFAHNDDGSFGDEVEVLSGSAANGC